MSILRTRLSPGHPWLNSTSPLAPASAPRPPRNPSATIPLDPTMPGLEVSELDSDTVFDRHFGPLTPRPATAPDQGPRRR